MTVKYRCEESHSKKAVVIYTSRSVSHKGLEAFKIKGSEYDLTKLQCDWMSNNVGSMERIIIEAETFQWA